MRYLIPSAMLLLAACSGEEPKTGCDTEGAFQCTGNILESCTGGEWTQSADCDADGGTCDAEAGECMMDDMTDMTGM